MRITTQMQEILRDVLLQCEKLPVKLPGKVKLDGLSKEQLTEVAAACVAKIEKDDKT